MSIASITFKLLFLAFLTVIRTRANSTACEQKERQLVLLDLAKESISKAKDLHPACGNDAKDISVNSSECGAKEKVSAYLDVAMTLIEEATKNYSTCDVSNKDKKVVNLQSPADCSEILKKGNAKSGRYTIWPTEKPLEVFCDMETEGGGWTLIQRRGQFSTKVDFDRNWNDYKNGFGNIAEEFWLGNDNIFALTKKGNKALRFDLEADNKERRYAKYPSFWIEGESAGYMLHLGNYQGNAGDGMEMAKNMQFSSKDKQDETSNKICPSRLRGGFWYKDCSYSNPNGLNLPGVKDDTSSMFWSRWRNYDSMRAIEIKIRPEN